MLRRLPVVLLIFLLVGCAGSQVKSNLTYTGSYSSYEKHYDNWTRSAKIYNNFSTEALVSATYLSLPMRRVFAAEWSRAFNLPEDQAGRVLADQINQGEQRIEFVVSFYTPKASFNDLHKPGSSWRLWFIDSQGNKVEAARVERLRVRHKKETLFFPAYDQWSQLYRVYFPRVGLDGKPLIAEAETVTLRVTGIAGQADLVWKIPPGVH
jgi:hypothetical protein